MTSKLGLHINAVGARRAEFLQFIAEAKPRYVLTLVDDANFFRDAYVVHPALRLIQRRYVPPQDQRLLNPFREAEVLADSLKRSAIYPLLAEHGGYWVGYNEIPGFTDDERYRLCDFDCAMAEHAHRAGVKYLCCSWSVGRPHIDLDSDNPMSEWQNVYPAIEASDGIAVHQYNAPSIWDQRDYDRGYWWRILRHRLVHDLFPEHLKEKRFFITESAIDSGAAGWPVPAEGGWRSFCTPGEHLEQLSWFDMELCKDDYVECALLFGWGTEDPTWDTFDCSKPPEMFHLLMKYLKEQNSEIDLDDPVFQSWLAEEAQRHVIPMNVQAYFRKVQREQGWDEALSDEFYPVPGVVAQVFYSRADGMQHIIFSKVGAWHEWRVVERQN